MANATETAQALAATQIGKQAAAEWLAGPDSVEEPRNPYPRPTTPDGWRVPSDFLRWSNGFNAEVYRVCGDWDADMERAERQAGC
jgi:hypothetical protein